MCLEQFTDGMYLFKVNNGNTRGMCEFRSKSTKKTPERSHWLQSCWLWSSKCAALRDLVPFVQFKKREKDPWRSVISWSCRLKLKTITSPQVFFACFKLQKVLNRANCFKCGKKQRKKSLGSAFRLAEILFESLVTIVKYVTWRHISLVTWFYYTGEEFIRLLNISFASRQIFF